MSFNYTETYVDFDHEIDLCKTYNLIFLTDQLLELKRLKIEQIAVSIFENLVNESYAISVSSRSANFYHNQSSTVAEQLNSKEFPAFKNFIITNDTKKLKSESSKKDNDLYEKNDESLIDTNNTQFHVLRSNDFDNEISLRQLNNNIKTNVDQCVKERISYYSYENFEFRNSELKKINLNLQALSKISF